jgi:hypothetical protein
MNGLINIKRNKMENKETIEEVLKVLHDKFNWNLTDSLTETGKKLVADTINALSIVQQEQENNKYNDEDLRTAYFSGIKTTGEGWNGEYANGNNPSIEEEFQEGFQEWLRQFKNK